MASLSTIVLAITVGAAANTSSVTVSGVMNEDSGQAIIGWADINTLILSPRKDEVYASVLLSGVPVSARSATFNLGIGV